MQETKTPDGCLVVVGEGAAPSPTTYDRNNITKAPPGSYRIANPENDGEKADRIIRVHRLTLYLARDGAPSLRHFSPIEWKDGTRFERVDSERSVTFSWPSTAAAATN